MVERPLLSLLAPERSQRSRGNNSGLRLNLPPHARQVQRLEPQFSRLESQFRSRHAALLESPDGSAPEQVIVLETAGSIQKFYEAVKKIPGMEWLIEWDDEEIQSDDDFSLLDRSDVHNVDSQLYLVMTDQLAMSELLSMWRAFQVDQQFHTRRGRAKWRSLFAQLRSVRFWDTSDRLRESGLTETASELVQAGTSVMRFEAEFWFRESVVRRRTAIDALTERLAPSNGRILSETTIEAIRYHAALVEMESVFVASLEQDSFGRVADAAQIKRLRPVGQTAILLPSVEPADMPDQPIPSNEPTGEPVVALLDGVPLVQHELLRSRIVVDDPDDHASEYHAGEHRHGTWMASLIAHGELDANHVPLARPIYVRPILQPHPGSFYSPREESTPDNVSEPV